MATQIGVITAVTGTVTATAADGSIRTLQAGDRVYANEVISTGSAGAIEIEFTDGSVMDLGRGSQAMLDTAIFNPNATALAETEGEEVPDDVAAIQQAILQGEDPTEAGEATAAGAGVEGSDGGHDAVFVNYLNPEVTPDAGFETIGVNSTVEDIEDEQLIDGVPTAGLVTVLLDEDDLSFRSDEEIAQAINDFINGIEAEFLADTGFNLYDYPNAGVGDEGQPGDDLTSPNPTFFSGTLNADYGFNGPGSISFNPVVSQPSGLTSGGEPVQICVSADGLTLIGYVAGEGEFSSEIAFQQEGPEFSGAEIIFSAQVDPATLNFTAGIYGPLDHPDTVEEGAFEENLLINMAFTITDADGDAAQGIIQLNVDDDSPVIGDQSEQPFPGEGLQQGDYPYGAESGLVDEDDTENGVGDTPESFMDDDGSVAITLPINFGADGPAAENPVELHADGIVDQFGNPLTSNGVEIQFNWNAATNTLEGTADGQAVINIHVNVFDYGFGTDSQIYVELLGNLDHPQGADGEVLGIEDNLNINIEYTASDADGDQVDGSFDLSIDDDMPVIGTPEAVSVDEEGINGNAGDSYDADAAVNGVLFMPELENGDLNSALDADAKQAIKSFVEAGGQLVINGSSGSNDETLLNDIFGFSISNGSNTSSNVPTFSQTGAVTGTDFESGPAQLNNPNGTYTWDISSLPAEATVMYSDGDDAAVVTIPVGDGQITFLAYDWYNAAPTGSQDGGWTDILDIAVSANGSPAEVSVFDNGSYVDTTSGGTSAESDNVQDTLQSQGHNVSIFTGITLADILAALPEFSTGDLAGEDTVASGSLAINWGADNNNDDASDFDRSVAFTEQVAPEGLTADGEPVSYSISEDGTMLTAFTGEAGSDSYTEVFTVSLSDAGNGSYEFTLLGNLDHPEANTEDDIDLSFEFIATDSDGDSAVGSFTVTVDDDAPVTSGETVEFTVDEDDINTELSEGNQPNDSNSDGSFTGSPLNPFDNGPANVTGSVASLVSFGADGAGRFTLTDNFDALLAQNLTSKGEALSFSVEGNVLSAEADGREVFTLTLEVNGEFSFELSDQLDHADANGENNLPLDLSSAIVATDADSDAITLDSGFVLNVTDDVPEQASPLPEVGIVEDEALPGGNQEINDFIETIDLGIFGTYTIAVDGWPDTAIATGSLADQVRVGADDPATFSLSGDFTQLISQNLTSGGEQLSYTVDGHTLYAVASQNVVFTLKVEANGDYTFTLMGPLDHADGILEESVLPIDFSALVDVTDADGDMITLDQDFYINVVDDSPEVANNAVVRLDDDALTGGNPGGPGDNVDAANVTGTLDHSFGADGGSIGWKTSGAPNGFSYETNGDDLLIKQDGETVLTLTLDPQTGDYTVTQNAPIEHRDNGNNNENNQIFNVGYLVTDGDGDTADGALRINVDDDTPTVEPYEVNTMRIISDDDTVAGLNGNPGEGSNTNDGAGTDSKEYNQSKTLQFSTGADGGTVAWSVDNSSVDDATDGISFSVNGDGSLIITQMQNGVPVQVAEITLDANTGEYNYTQTSNLLHTAGDNENEAAFTLGFTVTDGDGDTADGHLTLLIDDDTPVITSQQINLLTESFEDFAPDLSGNNWTVVGEGGGNIIGNNGIEWTVNGAGIEIQSGNVGGASASDGDAHAELDAHDSKGDGGSTLTQLSIEIELPTSEATLSFDFQPRPSDVDGSDMSVSLGGQTVNINVDGAGIIDFGSLPAGVNASQTSSAGGWTTITLTFTGLDTSSAQTLSFEGQGAANTLGAYIDNISLDAVASLTVDESALADGSGEAGASTTASFDFSGFFTGAFGADGPADADSESYSLNLSGEDIASGLYAVDNTDTDAGDGDGFGQGAEILLNQVNGDIVGSVGAVDYFTISVDAETGEVTLTQYENIWHADTTNPDDSQGMVLDSELLTLVKTITDADNDSAQAAVDLGGVSFNFEDDAPAISAEQPYVITVTNISSLAGYDNSYGYYIKGEDGEPISGEIIWANIKDNLSDEITVEVGDPADIGFFIIPNGAEVNSLNNGDAVTFQKDDEGNWQAVLDGEPLEGFGTHILFDNPDLNIGGANNLQNNDVTGNQNWEDTIGFDNDYDDANLNVRIEPLAMLTVDESDIGDADPSSATATLDLSGSFTSDFGADGPGALDYSLSVDTEIESGLVDTLSGKAVELRVNGDGVVEGYITTDDDMDLVVFTASVDDDGVVTLTQLRAVEHDDVSDPDESDAPATLNAGAIALTGSITDADGDSASDSFDVGVLFAFEDDGPVAADDSDFVADGIAEGNVVTADSTDGESGMDSYGADGPGSVTSVSFGDNTVEVPSEGSVEIAGDYGTLILNSDGSYTYTINPDSLPQNTQTVEGWENTGSNMTAFELGESFLTADGKYSDTGSGTVSTGGNAPGFGVAGTDVPNTNVPNQINYSGSQSEALAFKFDGTVTSATVQFSNMFQNENGGEAMRWHAFDADGNRIGSGIVSDNENASDPYANSTDATFSNNNIGSFTLSDIGAFTTLVFEGVPYSDDGSAGSDDSDFFVNVTSYEVFNSQDNAYQDEFGYTIVDGDGDSSSATLTLNGNSEPQQGQLEPAAPVAADNTYQVDGVTEGNIITDDDDNGGAASGRDYDNDTPVMNLSINSVIFNGTETFITEDGTEIELDNGTLLINLDGSYIYTPAQDADGGDEFEYTLGDPDGEISEPATVTLLEPLVSDVVTLGDVSVNEGDGTAVISGSVETPVTGSPLVISLSNGATITIPVGETSADSTPFSVQGDDVYLDGESYTVEVTDTTGGNYSSLDTNDDATVTINDTIDTTTVTLDNVSVAEDGTITYSASVDNAPQGNLTITLTNGVVITIPDGATTGTSAPQAAQGDDVYVDGESFNVGIQSTSGGNYEQLDTTDTATVTVSDNIDTVTATLTTSTTEVNEDGGDIIYTVTLSGGPGDIDPDTDLVFNLANGEQVTISAGDASGSFTRTYTDAEITNQVSITNSIQSVQSGGSEYEALQTAGETSVDVYYAPIPDELYVGNNQPNTYETEGGNDVLIGDLGGKDQQYNPGNNYSIALIADESGSMDGDRITLLKDALESFVNDLAEHDGVINIGLIGFGENATLEISVSDLANNPDGLNDLLTEIEALSADGGTNYEAAFDAAVSWFSSQPSGHEFISYFMTDGDPTYSNSGSNGGGSSTNYEDLFDAVQAFQALSGISEVNAIGIGSGVNTDYLRFFDNTNNTGTGSEPFGFNSNLLADFTDSFSIIGVSDYEVDELDRGWAKTGDSNGSVTTIDNTVSFFSSPDGYLRVRDGGGNGATIATSAVFAVSIDGSILQFDYETTSLGSSDQVTWSLQKQDGANWTQVSGGELPEDQNGDTVQSSPLESGNYRLVYTVLNGNGGSNNTEDLELDNVILFEPSDVVSGPVGEPQVINSAGELTAQLQTGNTTEGPAELGDDVLQGGEGDDVLIGDTLFTDNLTWTNDDTGETFSAGHGLGYEGLVEYLTWSLNNGTAPDDAQIMQYIRDNYDDLINPTPTQAEINAAGDDTLIGGGGNDILIGGEGADIFQWNEGDEGTAGSPAVDYVVDFDASEGDVLNLADLLDADGSNTIDATNLDDYLKANFDNGSNTTTIEVYTNGDANSGGQSSQNIVLNGEFSQQDLTSLLNNNNLDVDQS